jgi:chaperone BCS1
MIGAEKCFTRCILLLEDLDAAFTRSATRDDESTGAPTSTKEKDAATPAEPEASSSHHRSSRRHHSSTYTENVNTLSLSGLLNSLDGVAAAEGRILFA